jgi:2-C-methyl-D-erythritol 4-phosphate cytidylyltransferase
MRPDNAGIAAVICAAGASLRMGGLKKEYRPLPGHEPLTVLGAAVSVFAALSCIDPIVIAVPPDAQTGEAAAKKALPADLLSRTQPRVLFVPGGATRRASVHRALTFLAPYRPAYVLIHDGARPWLSAALITRLIGEVRKHHAVIPLLPLTETPKETSASIAGFDAEGQAPGEAVFIARHLRRAFTGTAQTPQAFAFPGLLAAHEQAAEDEGREGAEFTDDAEVWGAYCGPVALVPGSPENRKITFPGDLRLP